MACAVGVAIIVGGFATLLTSTTEGHIAQGVYEMLFGFGLVFAAVVVSVSVRDYVHARMTRMQAKS